MEVEVGGVAETRRRGAKCTAISLCLSCVWMSLRACTWIKAISLPAMKTERAASVGMLQGGGSESKVSRKASLRVKLEARAHPKGRGGAPLPPRPVVLMITEANPSLLHIRISRRLHSAL